ncbi:MAG: DUF4329 domain-containing protein [Planctomycetota bacterium]
MFPAARITDPITHDMVVPSGVIGPAAPAPCPLCVSAPVIIEGMPAAHVRCACICTGAISAGLVHPPPPIPPPIVKGSFTVLIHNMPAARWVPSMDMGACGVFLGDAKLAALRTVLIGDVGGPGRMGAPGAPIPPPSFASQDAAAVAALDAANGQSIAANTEFGGLIYQNADGTYGFTTPSAGTGTGFDPSAVSAPAGTTVVGDYHTHGDYSTADAAGNPVRTADPSQDAYNSDGFSNADRRGIRADAAGNPDYRGYLGTPSGTYREYDPHTNTERTLN